MVQKYEVEMFDAADFHSINFSDANEKLGVGVD